MDLMFRISLGMFVLLAGTACVAWIIWRLLKNSYDPAALMFRWVMSAVILGFSDQPITSRLNKSSTTAR